MLFLGRERNADLPSFRGPPPSPADGLDALRSGGGGHLRFFWAAKPEKDRGPRDGRAAEDSLPRSGAPKKMKAAPGEES